MTTPALLAISHGTASLAGQDAVRRLVDAVAVRLPDVTVRLGHVDVQDPDVEASLAALPAGSPVVVVPLLLSAGYHVHVDLTEATAAHPEVHLAAALGPDPRLARVLARRLGELRADASGARAADAVVLAVAGSSDERANEDCRREASMLAEQLGRPVVVGFLAAAEPRLHTAVEAARAAHDRVLVSSYLLAPGYFQDLAAKGGGDLITRPLLDADDPAPELVDLVVDRYLDCIDGPVASTL
ncbi:cobalamin biosynthesis protein CbiX [Agromyces sp. CFH 90414]|uniref:Cobalamin biosynthesis protein CbiX n=1 Tax=Agromyces agglutinans TaxID=2662258 RepID=A0A6I2FDC8_9MICO|nr:CbiX/SirB N-terminal domain-containing protein [Agromyces agglutinans]MRG59088.1 cobalamin biosynthesis protein CbiX [Agromyces agglutinans]